MTRSVRRGVREGLRVVLDVLFPVACVSCVRPGTWFCAPCAARVADPHPACVVCGERAAHGRTCAACRERTPLAGLIAAGAYQDPILRKAVHALKFSGIRDVAAPLGGLLARRVAAALGGALPTFTLVPIPLHPRRERHRGFNQAALIARHVSDTLGIEEASCLQRIRSASPQTTIVRTVPGARRNNVTGAFALAGGWTSAPPRALLLDDVATTGATLEEAADILYTHGAEEIWGAVICRG